MAYDKVTHSLCDVYCVTNLVTGKQYIGIGYTNVPGAGTKRRWSDHLWMGRTRQYECPLLHAAIGKYGESAFTVETLATANSHDEGKTLERFFIVSLGTLHPLGYNLTHGGEGMLGFKMPPEAIEESRQKRLGAKRTIEMRERMSLAHVGKKIPDHVRAKQSKTRKSRPDLHPSDACREAGRLASLGRVVPETQKRQQVATLRATLANSGLKGVYRSGGGWAVRIRVYQKRRCFLGTFATKAEAALIHQQALAALAQGDEAFIVFARQTRAAQGSPLTFSK